MTACDLSRREFVVRSGSCAAYLSATAAFAGPTAARLWAAPRRTVVAQEAWGRIEAVGDGLWALISTPLTGDYTTLSNGGIIRGRNGVLIVEGTASPEGAVWMAEQAKELAGRVPTHVVVTHHHGDHSRGVDGFSSSPKLHVTESIQDRVTGSFDTGTEPDRARPWADVTLIGIDDPTEIDLGGRTAIIRPLDGHTQSDLVVDLPEDGVTWCGDLVWNEMFPNYVDATPSRLSASVDALRADERTVWVPGHGPLADAADMATYQSILDDIGAAARRAAVAGRTAAEAAELYSLPEDVGEWTLFNPGYFERAIGAWMRELEG
ncbi:MAG: MBL fold metallo-hydrolase [Gemmatimonadota bacterium]|nr:MBL fold metallo-hydrolase [Gemmatimonadota bacterium]